MSEAPYLTGPAVCLGSGAEALALVSLSYEADTAAFLLDSSALPPAFFDLSSGVAGDVLQKLTNHGLQVAVVIPPDASWSQAFRQFAAETKKGRTFALCDTEAEARAWLARA